MEKILIKGAGDLASGIAWRLQRAGFPIIMTEIEKPLTVRLTVSYSNAVYENEVNIEGIKGKLVNNYQEAQEVIAQDKIAVIVDENADIAKEYKPDIIIDAIMAKKNINTKIDDAPIVIAVGPGFTAKKDCDYVIETKRGHFLGKVIEEGSAIKNTGVPGNIGGGGAAGHAYVSEGVDGGLNQHIGNREQRTLNAGRQTQSENLRQLGTVELHFPNVEAAGIRPAHQGPDDQHRGNSLGDGGSQSHTGYVHIQLGDEENVQDHVHNARNGQVSQRPLGISRRP